MDLHHSTTHSPVTSGAPHSGVIVNYQREGESLMDAFDRAERTWPGAGVMTFLAPHRPRGR